MCVVTKVTLHLIWWTTNTKTRSDCKIKGDGKYAANHDHDSTTKLTRDVKVLWRSKKRKKINHVLPPFMQIVQTRWSIVGPLNTWLICETSEEATEVKFTFLNLYSSIAFFSAVHNCRYVREIHILARYFLHSSDVIKSLSSCNCKVYFPQLISLVSVTPHTVFEKSCQSYNELQTSLKYRLPNSVIYWKN